MAEPLGRAKQSKEIFSMKGFAQSIMAVALVLATALPARAGSWDVCIAAGDINAPTDHVVIRGTEYSEFTAITTPLFPAGTFAAGQRTNCNTAAAPVGMFFARASALGNLPANQPLGVPDLYLAEWYFRFTTGGAFSTMGPIRKVP